jgi:two-component system alkaline phosphatase synthesis response regulator PhoP
MELLARIEALLRRSAPQTRDHLDVYRFGDVTVDFRRAEVTRGGRPVKLTSREFTLLRCFVLQRESVLTRDELLNEVWGYDETPYTRTVDVHVASLRQKLEPDPKQPQYILTVHGSGYKFIG